MAQEFQVIATQPWIYTDATGRVVNGYRVFFKVLQFDEVHEAFVPTLNPDTVKPVIEALVKARKGLSTL